MSFGTAYATKKRCMAKGGEVKGTNHEAEAAHVMGHASKKKMSHEEYMSHAGYSDADKAGIREGIKKQTIPQKMAEGGDVEEDADMIARIMHKRKEYARGGMVANDVGVAEADESPAEFDDLVLDDHLDGSQPVDSNEHGDEDVSDDPIDRVMMKKKKDKLPRPA